MMAKLLVCLLLLIAAVSGKHEKYEGHQLYRVIGPAQEIASLEAELDILTANPAPNSASGQLEALIRISPEEKQKWFNYFDQRNMPYKMILEDLAALLRQQDALNSHAKAAAIKSKSKSDDGSEEYYGIMNDDDSIITDDGSGDDGSGEEDSESDEDNGDSTMTWDAYYNAEVINNFIDEMGRKHSDKVVVINAGLSTEGRQIKYVRISTTRFEDLRKPVIIIDAATHAREWVTPPVACYIIQQLVEGADSVILDQIDWIIIPLVNPDGYEYTMEEDRMWRKTRSRNHPGSDACPGVDINRNFDHHWGTTASAGNPCAITYEGPIPFSEPETRVVRDVVYQNLDRAMMYLALHSFGNMFLYAWGNNGTLPSNGLSLHLAGVQMAEAIDALALEEANRYIVGNAAAVLYYTTGTSRDWTRAVGISLTYTVELPGYSYGFVVPPTYIKQIITETWAGVAAGGHYVLSLFN